MTWPAWFDAKAVIALVALVQPWVYWFYRRYGRGGSIDLHHTGSVEIGFSALGATVGLQGTMRAVDRDFFVSVMTIRVVRLSDGSSHQLEWGAFRPPLVLVGEAKDPVEMPAGFMLQPLNPRRYHIMFADMEAQAAVRQLTDPVQRAWFESTKDIPLEKRKEFYDVNFKNTRVHTDGWTELDRVIYWLAGDYELTLTTQTTRPDRAFTNKWRFTLTASDVTTVRLNRLHILAISSGQVLPFAWNFTQAPYKSA